ncbi:hypothetical protein [Enterococcus olivae]
MINNMLFSQISLFLANFKECASQGKIDYSEVKPKTTDFLMSIGWTYRAMNQYILGNIEPKHYFRGPSEHHNRMDCTVVEFGMTCDGIDLYVKLELIIQANEFTAGYMSFHPREQEIMEFPLDQTGEVR